MASTNKPQERPLPPPQKTYTTIVCGDGRVLPIVESLGRRVLREIDPASREGRLLLESGSVTIWSDDAPSPRRLPLDAVLREMKAGLNARMATRKGERRWLAHQRAISKALGRSLSKSRHRGH